MPKTGIDNQNDTLIFIGDYIDRGKFSSEVVNHVIHLQNEYKKVVCLRGNHEDMFAHYLEGMNEDMYLNNGGINTLHSYEIILSDDAEERKRKIPEGTGNFSNRFCRIMKLRTTYLYTPA